MLLYVRDMILFCWRSCYYCAVRELFFTVSESFLHATRSPTKHTFGNSIASPRPKFPRFSHSQCIYYRVPYKVHKITKKYKDYYLRLKNAKTRVLNCAINNFRSSLYRTLGGFNSYCSL